jgi:hypothetical protein
MFAFVASCPSKSAQTQKDGFALVIALVLMSFILMLTLTLSTLMRVESTVARNSLQQMEARQNALLGLQIAIGDLQRWAGVDTRATATAAIAENGGMASPQDSSRHWVGVWNSAPLLPSGAVNAGFGNHLAWLVSGAQPDPLVAPSAGQSFVTLALDENGASSLSAELIDWQAGNRQQGFAYAIMDQSVRAKILPRQRASPDLASERALFPLAVLPPGPFLPEVPELQTAFEASPQGLLTSGILSADMRLRGVDESIPASRFHDWTTTGYGLLTNPVHGGFKKDLTFGMRSGESEPSGLIFPPSAPPAAGFIDPGGPDWLQLRSFVNLGNLVSGNQIPPRPTTPLQVGIHPVVSLFQLYFTPVLEPAGQADEWRLHFLVSPELVLWNPYSVDLAAASYDIIFGRGTFLNNALDRPVSVDGTLVGRFPLRAPSQSMRNWSFQIDAPAIASGEAVVFSAPSLRRYVDANLPGATVVGPNPLYNGIVDGAGFLFDTGFFVTIPESEAATVDVDFSLQGSIQMGFELRLRAGDRMVRGDYLQIPIRIVQANPIVINSSVDDLVSEEANGSGFFVSDTNWAGYKIALRMTRNNYNPPLPQPGQTHKTAWLASNNPAAASMGMSEFEDSSNGLYGNPSYISYSEGDGSSKHIILPDLDGINAFAGYSLSGPVLRAVLYDIPSRLETISNVAMLSHAVLTPWLEQTNFGNIFLQNFLPAQAIANSRIPPRIDPSDTIHALGTPRSSSAFFYDLSYHLNEALWDDWFLSTLTTQSTGGVVFKNPSILPANEDITPAVLIANTASVLYVDGAFNVNSTSREAWRALFHGIFNRAVPLEDDSTQSPPVGEFTISRFYSAGSGARSGAVNVSGGSAFDGSRLFSSEDLDDLAGEVASRVQREGPFFSLATFVNRSLSPRATEDPLEDARMNGLLQRAIFAAGWNDAFYASSYRIVASDYEGYHNEIRDAFVGSTAEGLPQYVTQADFLARVGDRLTTRGDTFTIRVYGESGSINVADRSQVLLEAVVQRNHEFIDSRDPSAMPIQDLTQAVNRQFGRRYHIISIRWLNHADL